MKITKVCCQGCGANLQIDESVRYVTCNYCGAQLEVVHDESVTHTRRLDQIERKVRVLELESELEQMDQAWESFRKSALPVDEDGQATVFFSKGMAVAGGLAGVMAGVGIIWLGLANSFVPMVPAGILVIVLAWVAMKVASREAEGYQEYLAQEQDYETARKSLLQRLSVAQRA